MTSLTRALLDWYGLYGREHLPWRLTRDPYRIVVSEFMLQQTQVDRVLPLYQAFLALFPDFAALAQASTADVIRAWRGLGYNSRAVRLQRLARTVLEEHGGNLPEDAQALRGLPGIGPYTVAAVRVFAFERDDAAADVNIRRVVHRTVYGLEFPPKASVREVDASACASVPPGRGHDWNSAMMDLGATICTARAPKCLICPLRPHCAAAPIDAAELAEAMRAHAPKRSPQERIPFEKTTRYVRGRIVDRLRELPPGQAVSFLDLHDELNRLVACDERAFKAVVRSLVRDGIVRESEQGLGLLA
jgi:A/G-specific adenine glycosylase